jgi:APA family basic amino acid/polyamine antiporter
MTEREPGLRRVLGPIDAGWLVAGNMIGAGIFVMPGLVAELLPGFVATMAAWIAGGVLALAGAAVYAELGARIPRAGGDYSYLARAFGPVWGFLTGWAALLLTFSAAAAAMTLAAIEYLRDAARVSAVSPWVGAAFVLALTGANLIGARASGRTTAWLTAIPVAALVVVFVLAVGSGDAPRAAAWGEQRAAWPIAFGRAMVFVFFTYSGWNVAAYLAGEMKDPGRNLARGLLGGAAFVTAVYLMVNVAVLWAVPPAELAGSTTAAVQVVEGRLGSTGSRLVSVIVAIAILGSANVTLMAGARVYYAMAQDGLAPRILGRTSSAGVPAAALWVGGLWTAALTFFGKVEELYGWATLAILLLSSLAVVSLFVLRRRGVGNPAYLCTWYPVTPIVYLVASIGVAAASAVHSPRQALYGILLVAAGFPAYAVAKRTFGGNAAAVAPTGRSA